MALLLVVLTIEALVAREMTRGAFMMAQRDGKFSSDCWNESDAPFVEAYDSSTYVEDCAARLGVSDDNVNE